MHRWSLLWLRIPLYPGMFLFFTPPVSPCLLFSLVARRRFIPAVLTPLIPCQRLLRNQVSLPYPLLFILILIPPVILLVFVDPSYVTFWLIVLIILFSSMSLIKVCLHLINPILVKLTQSLFLVLFMRLSRILSGWLL